jgi:hypothetical protein
MPGHLPHGQASGAKVLNREYRLRGNRFKGRSKFGWATRGFGVPAAGVRRGA